MYAYQNVITPVKNVMEVFASNVLMDLSEYQEIVCLMLHKFVILMELVNSVQ